jgi:hypothetical protein
MPARATVMKPWIHGSANSNQNACLPAALGPIATSENYPAGGHWDAGRGGDRSSSHALLDACGPSMRAAKRPCQIYRGIGGRVGGTMNAAWRPHCCVLPSNERYSLSLRELTECAGLAHNESGTEVGSAPLPFRFWRDGWCDTTLARRDARRS